MQSSTNLRSNR